MAGSARCSAAECAQRLPPGAVSGAVDGDARCRRLPGAAASGPPAPRHVERRAGPRSVPHAGRVESAVRAAPAGTLAEDSDTDQPPPGRRYIATGGQRDGLRLPDAATGGELPRCHVSGRDRRRDRGDSPLAAGTHLSGRHRCGRPAPRGVAACALGSPLLRDRGADQPQRSDALFRNAAAARSRPSARGRPAARAVHRCTATSARDPRRVLDQRIRWRADHLPPLRSVLLCARR